MLLLDVGSKSEAHYILRMNDHTLEEKILMAQYRSLACSDLHQTIIILLLFLSIRDDILPEKACYVLTKVLFILQRN